MDAALNNLQVFISYCWSPDENKNWVHALARKLYETGIYVHLDIWDLQPGQDKYVFMEGMVNKPEIKNVLIVINKEYCERANDRKGGVGTESQIITPELYGNAKQTKFIPIVREFDASGNPYLPIFLNGRRFIDFSSESLFQERFEELKNAITGNSTRPILGALISKNESQSVDPNIEVLINALKINENQRRVDILPYFEQRGGMSQEGVISVKLFNMGKDIAELIAIEELPDNEFSIFPVPNKRRIGVGEVVQIRGQTRDKTMNVGAKRCHFCFSFKDIDGRIYRQEFSGMGIGRWESSAPELLGHIQK